MEVTPDCVCDDVCVEFTDYPVQNHDFLQKITWAFISEDALKFDKRELFLGIYSGIWL
jgi:hypothetical protein